MSVDSRPEGAEGWGIYVHLPFCRYRCPYCAFVVDAREQPPHAAYAEAVLRQWAGQAAWFAALPPPNTLYFGGGTPSRTPPAEVARLIAALPIDPAAPGVEISLEANPEDCVGPEGAARLAAWRAAGVNRLSVGAQSFDEAVGARLGRRRGSRAAAEAILAARAAGFASVSADLIFGGPGQSEEDLWADIAQAVALKVDHLSLYGLTQEEGTAFGRLGERLVGELGAADEERWAVMYEGAVERLGAAGLARYEVSNFARPGHRSEHNRHYWLARPWAGLGAGAHGFLPGGQRTESAGSVDGFLSDPGTRVGPADDPLLGWDLLWSGLRVAEGLDRARYEARARRRLVVPSSLAARGVVWEHAGRIGLGAAGFPLADAVARRLWEASVPMSSLLNEDAVSSHKDRDR